MAHFQYPTFHLVLAPGRTVTAEDPGPKWPEVRAKATELYSTLSVKTNCACVALGSIKVNPIVELALAACFSAAPFVSQDHVAKPTDRDCPILFRFRETDPQPPACCGGVQLAANSPADAAGLYYETEINKKLVWECCPCEAASSDAAFVFYAYYPNAAHAEVACGGFSSRATSCLTKDLEWITSQLGEPQYVSETLRVGLYVIHFTFDPANTDFDQYRDERPFKTKVIRLSEKVIQRRMKPKAPTFPATLVGD